MEIKRTSRREYGKTTPGRPRRSDDNRSSRSFDKPRRSEHSFGEDKPRSFDKPRRSEHSFGEDKPRSFDRPRRSEHSFGEDKPRSFDRPRRSEHSFGEDKPRSFDRPRRSEHSFGEDKPRSFDRPRRSEHSFGEDKPRSFDRPRRSEHSFDKPRHSEKKAPAALSTEMRLNKFIANSGVCSRREADRLIQAGVVTVNGEVVTELGTRIDTRKDTVLFGDQKLRGEEKVYIIMNKPKGFVTTTSDPHAEQTVMDLLTKCPTRVFPVGRLDKNTTGVLMFTNDGELSEKLTHPSFNKKKIYEATLDKRLSAEDFNKILSGIELEDGPIAADELSYTDANDMRKIGIEIHSGKNRIVRRIFESLGYQVKVLDRVYFAGLTKKGIKRGQWRYLTTGEINILKMGAFN